MIQTPQQFTSISKTQQNSFAPFYRLQQKLLTPQTGLFKLLKYDQHHIMFSAPDAKCIAVLNANTFQSKNFVKINYDDKPLAIDLVQLGNAKFLISGGHKGVVNVKAVSDTITEVNGKSKLNIKVIENWQFKPKSTEQVFVNQIVHSQVNPNIIVNCYNNGNVAVWGLLSSKRLHTFENLHQKYTYKLRFQTPNILLSCGNDSTVMRTDLQEQKPISVFNHALPVWCAYPINQNQIASVGLFGRVLVWDVRSNRIVQACNNRGNQSSYITARNSNQMCLFYGDSNMLVKWDRRKAKSQDFTKHNMGVSTQAILFNKDKVFACGRGRDLCRLSECANLENQQQNMQAAKKPQILIFESSFEHIIGLLNQGIQVQIQDEQEDSDEQYDVNQDQENQQLEQNMQDQSEQQLLPKQKNKKTKNHTKNMELQKISMQKITKLSQDQIEQFIGKEQEWLQSSDSSQYQQNEEISQKVQKNKDFENEQSYKNIGINENDSQMIEESQEQKK